MGRWSATEICQRAAEAENARSELQNTIDLCMAVAMPWRHRHRRRRSFMSLFDSTAPTAVQRFGSRLQRDITPPFQRWMKLECGPLVPAAMMENANRKLEMPTDIIHAVLDASGFPKSSRETYSDLAVGTGALLATEGDDHEPIRWTSAPAWALGIEEGPGGRIDNVFYEKLYPAWTLPRHWPGAKWPQAVQEKIADNSTSPIKILQASYYDSDTRGWRIAIVCRQDGDKEIAWETERRTNPWIIPRWWTTPGGPWGYGPLMLALPDILTLNKTVEMVLRAAAYSLAPPLMVAHDGVVNPDTMRLSPNALIRVARTGGPMGKSIEPMDIGSRVDLAQIVLQELRTNTNKNLLNEQLPPETGAVRSASEIVERAKQLQYDAGAAFGSLNHEFVPQVVATVIDILDKKKVAGISWADLRLDQMVLKVNIISPLARSQNLDDVQSVVQWLETMKAIGGDAMVAHASKIEDVGPYLGRTMGARPSLIRSQQERDALEQTAGAVLGAQAQAQQQGGQPGGAPQAGGGGATPAPFATPALTLGLPAPTPGPAPGPTP